MKKTIAVLLTVAAVAYYALAGIFVIGSNGSNIAANSTTNFPTLIPIGSFTLNQQNLSQYYAGCTNPGSLIANGRLTFDGTNFFLMPQQWTNATAGASNGAVWTVATTNYTVYAQLSVSNGTSQVVSNYQAILSN